MAETMVPHEMEAAFRETQTAAEATAGLVDLCLRTQQKTTASESSNPSDTAAAQLAQNEVEHAMVQSLVDSTPYETASITVPRRPTYVHDLKKDRYVGLSRLYRAPEALLSRWRGTCRQRLMHDLEQVRIESRMSSERFKVELDLVMAGHSNHGAEFVELKPTILIRCGDRKCKKVVQRAIAKLEWIQQFLSRRECVICKVGVASAAGSTLDADNESAVSDDRDEMKDDPTQPDHHDSSIQPSRLKIAIDIDALTSRQRLFLPPLELQLTRRTPQGRRFTCTVGGLIQVGAQVYGLTAAHALLSALDDHDSPSNLSDSSDCYDSSDSDSSTDMPLPNHRFSQRLRTSYDNLEVSTDDSGRTGTAGTEPANLVCFGFGKLWSTNGKSLNAPGITTFCDVAVLELPPWVNAKRNLHRQRRSALPTDAQKLTKTMPETLAEVFVILPGGKALAGWLFPECHQCNLFGERFETRKVELWNPLEHGCSGAWVMRGAEVMGHIIAVYTDEPYAHMVPMPNILESLRDLLDLTDESSISLPTVPESAIARRLEDLSLLKQYREIDTIQYEEMPASDDDDNDAAPEYDIDTMTPWMISEVRNDYRPSEKGLRAIDSYVRGTWTGFTHNQDGFSSNAGRFGF